MTISGSRLDVTGHLARVALGMRFADLPPDVVTRSRHCLLDWLAVTLAGWNDDAIRMLLEEAREEGGASHATLFGTGERLGMRGAALVNGTAGHVLDFDDVHLRSRVHPSAPLWPAILALAERYRLTFDAVIAAFVAGVEVQSRIAALMGEDHYRRGWHNTGTLGTFGATVASARLRELDEERTRHALAIAATQAAGLRALFGTMGKPLHAGRAAACGILSSGLAARGFRGQPDIFDRPDGFHEVLGGEPHPAAALREDADLQVRSIVFKWHASCYGTHAPIEAAKSIAGRGLDPDSVSAIEIRIEPQYLSVCDIPEPATATEAKFSVRHAVALALAGWNTADEASFSPVALRDPRLARLRGVSRVVADPSLRRANAAVRVVAGAGPIVGTADASRAEEDLSVEGARVREKAMAITRGRMTESAARTLVSAVLEIGPKDDVSEFARHVVGLVRA